MEIEKKIDEMKSCGGHCPVVRVASSNDAWQASRLWFMHFGIKVYYGNLARPIWHTLLKQHWYLGLSAVVALATLVTFSVTYAVGVVLGSILLPYLDILYHNLAYCIPNVISLWSVVQREAFNSSCCYWVAHCPCAVCRGRVVGLVAAKRMSEEKLELVRMYVSPSIRGHGVGTKLCDKVLEFAEENRYSEIHLFTLLEFTPAVNLYQRCGYTLFQCYGYPFFLMSIPSEIAHMWRPVKKIDGSS